jgi:hypothetical protein
MFIGLALADDLPKTLMSVKMHEAAYVHLMTQAAAAENKAEVTTLELRAAEALWEGELWDTAILHFSRFEDTPSTKLGFSYSHFRAGSPMAALKVLDGDATAETYYLAGWCYLELGQPQAAYDAWGKIPPQSGLHAPSLTLQQSIGGTWEIPRRSPALAGTMSAIIPGTGQIYSGRLSDGASAFFVNGLLAALNWQLAKREIWSGVGIVGFVQLGFFGGNIFSAINSAHKFNRTAWDTKMESLSPHAPRLKATGPTWSMVVDSPAP